MPGSVETDQVVRLAGQSLALMKEISKALSAGGTTLSKVAFGGVRLGRHWANLSGARIAPYAGVIGKRTLTIDAVVQFYSEDGRVLDIDDPQTPQDAMYIAEREPTWAWSNKSKKKK